MGEDSHVSLENLIIEIPGDNHNYQTRASTKRILDTPLYKTNTYGTHSAKYHCILDWNQFKRIFPNLSETDYTYSKLRSLIKLYFLIS